MMWALRVLGSMVVLLVVYVSYLILDAWLETKAAPRAEMFFCQRHGFMRKEHTIKLVDWADEPVCPRCFSERMTAAERVMRQPVSK